jgi:phosphate:Na+ symporter
MTRDVIGMIYWYPMEQIWITTGVSLVAIIVVFLFAVEKFSRQMQYLVGGKFKTLLGRSTDTPAKGILTGTVVTSILQSSTAVSVMLVSLVDAGILSFQNSLGVIIGANIGTTITTQLIAFKVLAIAPYILVAGFLLMKIKSKYQRYGKAIFYFGLIFSSLFLVSALLDGMERMEGVMAMLAHTSNLFIAIGVGFILAVMTQSSSIASGVVVLFAAEGYLGFAQAFGMILGANIGTTTTTLLASAVTGKQGKRVAVAHAVFNVVGVLLFVPFVSYAAAHVGMLPFGTAEHVAFAHLFFNLVTAVVFWVGFPLYGKIVHRLVP